MREREREGTKICDSSAHTHAIGHGRDVCGRQSREPYYDDD